MNNQARAIVSACLVALVAGCHGEPPTNHPDSGPVIDVNKPRPTNVMEEYRGETNRIS